MHAKKGGDGEAANCGGGKSAQRFLAFTAVFGATFFHAIASALFSVVASAFARSTLVLAPSARNGAENFRLGPDRHRLLLLCQFHHAPGIVGIAEGGEDPVADAENRPC